MASVALLQTTTYGTNALLFKRQEAYVLCKSSRSTLSLPMASMVKPRVRTFDLRATLSSAFSSSPLKSSARGRTQLIQAFSPYSKEDRRKAPAERWKSEASGNLQSDTAANDNLQDSSDIIPFFQLVRVRVVLLVALALVLCNADRVIMAVTIVPLAAANGWGEGVAGIVQSSFLWGYLLTPIIGGALADRYGGKIVLAVGIGVWSTATLATPWAAGHSLGALLAVRVVMGLGEGVALPCMNNMMARWMPRMERARAVGACFAGFHLGSMGGLLLAPVLMSSSLGLGVTGPFLVFGLLGHLWLLTWLLCVTPTPGEHPSIRAEELATIRAGQDPPKAGAVSSNAATASSGSVTATTSAAESTASRRGSHLPPFGMLLSKAPVWAIICANAVNSWSYFVLLSWMPVYFTKVLGLDLRSAAWFSAGPWAVMAAVGYCAAAMADALTASGMSITRVRKTIGFGGPAVALVGLSKAKSPEGAALWLTAALGFSAFSQAGFLVNYQDVGPRYAGVLHGMSNTAGTVAGIVSTVFTGFLVERLGSFQAVLALTSAIYVVGLLVWNVFSTGERIFD
eukprot:jgi/Mesen1/8968/ME000056S08380